MDNKPTTHRFVAVLNKQKQRTSETPELEIEYFGVCFFGEDNQLRELTKKFSLWR